LKVRLEQADKDAKSLELYKNLLATKSQEVEKLNSIVEEYRKHDARNSELDQRERELNKMQFNLELEILKSQLTVEKEKSEFVKSVTMGLVRNTEYRKSVFDTENQIGWMNGGKWVQPSPIAKSLTETKTEE